MKLAKSSTFANTGKLFEYFRENMHSYTVVLQAYSVARFLWNYAIPVGVFAYCYGRIFHTIRRQSKVVGGHAAQNQGTKATTSRGQGTTQVQQQQATGATTSNKLSRTELNVIKTMVAVICVFMIFWSVTSISNLLILFGVCMNVDKLYPKT